MIEIRDLVKHFAGAPRPAIDHLTLTVPAGEVCVLIGPSGCGKTTTMRMINRMIEPDGGTRHGGGPRHHGGRSGRAAPQHRLRHPADRTVSALVDRAEHRDGAAAPAAGTTRASRARVDELLALVGMDPAQYRDRFPRELSGGQRQRVGVARALAADPPVMLMDEPFGAIDPITRARLQDEFLDILRSLEKTIVFVTHDIDEAIKMGDRIAILRDGALVQYDTPEAILARPADAFVESFVGTDRALKRLALDSRGRGARAAGRPRRTPHAIAATRPCATRWR